MPGSRRGVPATCVGWPEGYQMHLISGRRICSYAFLAWCAYLTSANSKQWSEMFFTKFVRASPVLLTQPSTNTCAGG